MRIFSGPEGFEMTAIVVLQYVLSDCVLKCNEFKWYRQSIVTATPPLIVILDFVSPFPFCHLK
jgi:hypothetical protein